MTCRAQFVKTARFLRRVGPAVLCFSIVSMSIAGCSGSDGSGSGAGGSSGAPSGGANSSGGTGASSVSSTRGGTTSLGGAVNAGGVPGTGGAKAIGGTNSTGGSLSTGGANSTGGTATSGGAGATGGTASTTGGTASTGGSKAAGGASNIGGNTSTGGTKPTGGTASTGGSKPAGGATSTGGSKSTGGTVATGGSNSTGGATGTGGGSGTDMCGRTTTITVPSGYTKLAWHDEFDVSGTPNSANWGYETGFVRNNELQWYQSQNASVSGGLLTITGKREQVTNPNYNPNGSDWKTTRQYAQYTSASMTTSGKQSWKFGRFEMCGKIPISAGMWPAWWTLGVSGEWPSNGEIDIMEYYNGKILANIAWATSTRWTAHWDSSTKAVDAAWAAQYHLWRMDWDSTKIDLYVDDTLMNTGNLSAMLNDTNGQSPFLQNAYMIVNLAIGGDNGGDPSGTTFPQQYLIDYIRVFQ